jgi:tetratricopeptide (TPR) repeat protein
VALSEARAVGIPSVTGDVLQSLAVARGKSGDVAAARSLFAEALEIFRSTGADRACLHITGNLAEAEFHEGNAIEALRLETEALAMYRAFHHGLGAAISLSNIAAYLIALKRYDEARVSAREGLTAARNERWEAGVAWGLQHLAAISLLQRDGDAARARRNGLRAATLVGYVDARLRVMEAVRGYTEQREHDEVLLALRDALGEAELAKLTTEGAAWTEDRAVEQGNAM